MQKCEIREDIPEKFYMDNPGTGFPVVVYTVGELKEALMELPDDLDIRKGFEKGVQVTVFNVGYTNTHLSFEESELPDPDDDNDESEDQGE